MLKEVLASKAYLPILETTDGLSVTPQTWPQRRQELKELLETYSYGKTPDLPVRVWGETVAWDANAYAGKVRQEKLKISMETERGLFSFPIELFVPQSVQRPPVFLHLAFRPVPDRYIPVEEITDAGYALVVLVYKDLVNDNPHGDFTDGLAAYFGTTADRSPVEWGKIGMWAYGASRVMDYIAADRPDLDSKRVAVIGHSRLGKTALWCAAQDERFAAAISNDSGYGGAASSKHGKGERVTDFLRAGSWDWFCENFKQFSGDGEDTKPYDQSFLSALIAPRYLCVGSAVLDTAADPEAEFLTTLHASTAWELLGVPGLICPDRMPIPGDHFSEGHIGYHLRDHRHYLSREDWNAYIRFLDQKFRSEES
ncbi:MAG: acetylxylan esterase [Ruminococcaceae bacterium]|nr:acetylxylan esterase [Oscillospiraceae bacterium]